MPHELIATYMKSMIAYRLDYNLSLDNLHIFWRIYLSSSESQTCEMLKKEHYYELEHQYLTHSVVS